VRLLRALEEREVTRLGGTQAIPVDVRVVAATNRALREHVAEGTFRSDLYYRLNVLRIELPPLRERRGDVPLLVRRFVTEFSARHDRPFHGISGEAMRLLVDYPWPGNVRELRNLVESMVVLAPGREVGPGDLPPHIRDADALGLAASGGGGGARLLPVPVGPLVREGQRAEGRELEFIVRGLLELKLQVEELRRRLDEERAARVELQNSAAGAFAAAGGAGGLLGAGGPGALEARDQAPPPNVVTVAPGTTMAAVERAVIEAALRETGGNRRRAAELLGIGERTLYRKLNEYQAGVESATLLDGGDGQG
jgi:DNA-binding NtrC family response regulator